MGFSPLGLVVAVAVLAPNLILLWAPPRDGLPSARVPAALTWTERAGQALCLVAPVITAPGTIRWWWAVPATVGLVGYYLLWGRYLATGRVAVALYGPVWGIPLPMAVLPVIVFLSAGIWLDDVWIVGSALVLAAGHIPASAVIARAMTADG